MRALSGIITVTVDPGPATLLTLTTSILSLRGLLVGSPKERRSRESLSGEEEEEVRGSFRRSSCAIDT